MSHSRNAARLAATGMPSVSTPQDLRDMTIFSGIYPPLVSVLGVASHGVGGGIFAWDATSTLDDNTGTVIKPTGVDGGLPGRWLREWDLGELDVCWFGAVGDGVADDTSAIQATINAAPDGATVIVPPGQYKITATIDACCPGISIVGTGGYNHFDSTPNNAFVLGAAIAGPMMRFGPDPDSDAAWRGGHLSNLTFNGDRRAFACDEALLIEMGTQSVFESLRFFYIDGSAIRVRRAYKARFYDIDATQCGNIDKPVIDFSGEFTTNSANVLQGSKIDALQVENWQGANNSALVIGERCHSNQFSNLGFEQGGYILTDVADGDGYFIDNDDVNQFSGIHASRMNFNQAADGIWKINNHANGGSSKEGATWTGIASTGAAPQGVFQTTAACTLNGLTVEGTTNLSKSISVSLGADNCHASNIVIENGGGVYLGGNGSTLKGCSIKNCTTEYGVRVAGSSMIMGIAFDGFDLAVPDIVPTQAIHLTGDHASVIGCRVTNVGANVEPIRCAGIHDTVVGAVIQDTGSLDAAIRATVGYATITDCTIRNHDGPMIWIQGAYATISGNTFTTGAGYGLQIQSGGCVITGNSFFSITENSIRFEEQVPAVLQGNHIASGGDGTNSAVYFNLTANTDGAVCNDNHIRGTFATAFDSSGTGGESYVRRATFTGNVVYNAGGISQLIKDQPLNMLANNIET